MKNNSLKKYGIFFITLFISSILFGETPVKDSVNRVDLTILASYNQYRMKDFNTFLSLGNNKNITGGYNLKIELGVIGFTFSGKVDGIGVSLSKIKLPIGIEYINARSKTNHSQNNTIVDWNLPVFGIYLTPDILFNINKNIQIGLRPISFGYYFLGIGKNLKAELTVSDRKGNLKLNGNSFGFMVAMSVNIGLTKNVMLVLNSGYRFLNFTTINQKSEDGFTFQPGGQSIPSTDFPYDLDYSGFLISFGVKIKL